MKVIQVPTHEIKHYEFNNRTHPDEQIEHIAQSIKEFGFNQPLVITKDNEIIAGHGRHLAAKKLGLKEVPCVQVSDLTEQQVKAYRIVDNKLQNDSKWAFNNLELEIGWLEDNDFDISQYGLDSIMDIMKPEEIDPVLEDVQEKEIQQITFLVPTSEVEYIYEIIDPIAKGIKDNNARGLALLEILKAYDDK